MVPLSNPPRNTTFTPLHEPLRSHPALEIQQSHTTGPFAFLNPTRTRYAHKDLPQRPSPEPIAKDGHVLERGDEQQATDIHFQWRSRDNRKGRHALVVQRPPAAAPVDFLTPESSSSPRAIARGVLRMFVQYPYWDVSWLVAVLFTLGSVVWVINGFFAYLPLVQRQTEFDTEILYGGGITAFIGAIIFEVGSVLLMIEAVNENRAGCFGWAVERALVGEGGEGIKLRADRAGCTHHHTNRGNLVGKADLSAADANSSASSWADGNVQGGKRLGTDAYADAGKAWQWFPTRHDLKTHYLRELGFLASLAQLFGASVFWISGLTALPGINNLMSQGLLDGIYWVPQIVGGAGFIVSGVLFMLETQPKWYVPALNVLGWHIGFWNLVGAFGFCLCGALGPAYLNGGAQYEAALATFWGSWAFLIGSLLQWYECLDTHPVEERGRG